MAELWHLCWSSWGRGGATEVAPGLLTTWLSPHRACAQRVCVSLSTEATPTPLAGEAAEAQAPVPEGLCDTWKSLQLSGPQFPPLRARLGPS